MALSFLGIVLSTVNVLQVTPLFFLGSTLIFIGTDLLFEWVSILWIDPHGESLWRPLLTIIFILLCSWSKFGTRYVEMVPRLSYTVLLLNHSLSFQSNR